MTPTRAANDNAPVLHFIWWADDAASWFGFRVRDAADMVVPWFGADDLAALDRHDARKIARAMVDAAEIMGFVVKWRHEPETTRAVAA